MAATFDRTFRVVSTERELDEEGKESRVLIKLDKNDSDAINLINSNSQMIIEVQEIMRK